MPIPKSTGSARFWSFVVATALGVAVGSSAIGAAAPGVADSDLRVVRVDGAPPDVVARLAERFDPWSCRAPRDGALFAVPAADLAELEAEGLSFAVHSGLTAALHEAARRRADSPLGSRAIPGFSCYRTVEETYADLAQLAAENPQLATWSSIGISWEETVLLRDGFESGDLCGWEGTCPEDLGEGYPLGVLVLGNVESAAEKAPFVIIAAMHARELATAEIATRFAEELVAGHGVDPDATWILDHVEIHVIPQLNPDGRKHAEAGDFWRKNTNDAFCPGPSRGVDLNRNSSFEWGGAGSSASECSSTFRGPIPASEPETRAIEEYLAAVFPDQRGPGPDDAAGEDATGIFVSIHSFGPTILYPWEYDVTANPAPDEAGLRTFGLKLAERNGYDASQDLLSPAAGTTVDEAYGNYGVASYTFEVGTTFFEDCTTFENTVSPDNLAALRYAARSARRPYRAGLGPDVVDPALGPFPPRIGGAVLRGSQVDLVATADATLYGPPATGSTPAAVPSAIAAVRYSIDAPPWVGPTFAMDPADGTFDETVEDVTASISTAGLEPGTHLVFVEAEDVDGDVGPPVALFLEIAGPRADLR